MLKKTADWENRYILIRIYLPAVKHLNIQKIFFRSAMASWNTSVRPSVSPSARKIWITYIQAYTAYESSEDSSNQLDGQQIHWHDIRSANVQKLLSLREMLTMHERLFPLDIWKVGHDPESFCRTHVRMCTPPCTCTAIITSKQTLYKRQNGRAHIW